MAIELSGKVLDEMSAAVMRMKATRYGRGPDAAKSFLNDDLLTVVLRGGFLEMEEFMISRNREDVVRDVRTAWEKEIGDEMIYEAERITGHKVRDYFSQVLVDAQVIVELFLLEPRS